MDPQEPGVGWGGHLCSSVRRVFPSAQEVQLRTQREGSLSVIKNLLTTGPEEGASDHPAEPAEGEVQTLSFVSWPLCLNPKPHVLQLSALLEPLELFLTVLLNRYSPSPQLPELG